MDGIEGRREDGFFVALIGTEGRREDGAAVSGDVDGRLTSVENGDGTAERKRDRASVGIDVGG